MKNYLIVGLMCLLAALVFGVAPIQRVVNEAIHKGTLRGVENCMKYSSSKLLSEEAVKAMCVEAIQKSLYHNDHATGRAGPMLNQRTVGWGGTLKNKTPDHVTTWVKISVSIYDADGTEQEHFAETQIWIDPLDDAEFKVQMPDLKHEELEDTEFCEHNESTPKDCMTWGVVDVMGVSV